MILYFTGTGNSRYAANLLARQLGDEAVDAAQLIREGRHPDFVSEKPYVFVAPVYAWRMPRLFQQWIAGCGFAGSRKAYFVLTCGSSMGAAGNYTERFAEKLGFAYMGTAQVVMPENYIVMFSAPPREQDEEILSAAAEWAGQLGRTIEAEEPFDRVKNSLVDHLCSDLVTPMFYTFYIGAKKFYATDKCISCGKCEESCMLNNIRLREGRPVWGGECCHCMACISKCPTEAIEYGKHTVGLRRYVCPRQ